VAVYAARQPVKSNVLWLDLVSQVDYLLKTMPRRGTAPMLGVLLEGRLVLLVVLSLAIGAALGLTFGVAFGLGSVVVLQVEHGSLYPALHRLEDRGWISSFWGTSENNRRARYYRLTPQGRAQLLEQTTRWDEMVRAVNRILRPTTE
jgi:transcriptional regulator